MNIYLHHLDEFISGLNFSKGKKRKVSPKYRKIAKTKAKVRKKIDDSNTLGLNPQEILELKNQLKDLTEQQLSTSYGDQYDLNYKRLWYCRYADDFVLGLIGSKKDAQIIKHQITSFISDELKLNVAPDKTGIQHAKDGILFLGYEIEEYSTSKRMKNTFQGRHTTIRTVRDQIRLKVPKDKVIKFCREKGYGNLLERKPSHRPVLLPLSDAEIISAYNAELRGLAHYYALANDVKLRLGPLFYITTRSLVNTLANKHRTKATKMYAMLKDGTDLIYKFKHKGKPKQIVVYKLKSLARKTHKYSKLDIPPNTYRYQRGSELIARIYSDQCEICGVEKGYFEVHHVKKLSDMKNGKERWQRLMMERNRKTLILCIECHDLLHAGKLPDWRYLKTA